MASFQPTYVYSRYVSRLVAKLGLEPKALGYEPNMLAITPPRYIKVSIKIVTNITIFLLILSLHNLYKLGNRLYYIKSHSEKEVFYSYCFKTKS